MQLYEYIESEPEKQQAGNSFDHQALSAYRPNASIDERQRKRQFQINRKHNSRGCADSDFQGASPFFETLEDYASFPLSVKIS
jgi:hypothetical protein